MKETDIMKAKKKKSDEVLIEVTEADYEAGLAKGIEPESLLKPGKHKFIRGGFKKLHPEYDPKTAKVRITMYVDAEVLEYFRRRASDPNAAPYQTQMNNVLREAMDRDQPVGPADRSARAPDLAIIKHPAFLKLLDERIAAQINQRKRGRKAA